MPRLPALEGDGSAQRFGIGRTDPCWPPFHKNRSRPPHLKAALVGEGSLSNSDHSQAEALPASLTMNLVIPPLIWVSNASTVAPQQLRQLGDIGGDAPGLVEVEQGLLRLPLAASCSTYPPSILK